MRPAPGAVDVRTGTQLTRAVAAARHEAGDRTRLRVIATGRLLRTVTNTGLDEVLAVYPTRTDAIGR